MRRYTFFFKNSKQGWSETFFRANAFEGSGSGLLEAYIVNRLALMATTCSLESVRSSDVGNPRDITVFPIPTGGRFGTWVYGAGDDTFTNDPACAILLRLTDGANNFRSFPLLGVSDHLLSFNQIVPSEVPNLTGRLNNWIAAVNAAGFGMKKQDAPTSSGRVVKFFPKTDDNQMVCLGLDGVIPGPGTAVILGAVKGFPELNRLWKVASSGPAVGGEPGFIYLRGSTHINTYGPVEGGTYKVPAYSLSVLNSYSISRLTTRKTGVPFGTVRGRR